MTRGLDKGSSWKSVFRAVLQGILAGIVLGAAFAAGFFYRDFVWPSGHSDVSFELLNEADGLLNEYYLFEIPDERVRIYGAIEGLVASYEDPYTVFVEPQTAELDTGNLAGRFGGIGAEIAQDEQGRYVISQVYRDNPAFEAGVQAGDIIVAVDGQEIDPTVHDMNAVLSMIRGEVGEKLELAVSRDGQTLNFEMTRAEVLVPSTFWRILEEDGRVGYIQITRFTDRSPNEVRQAVTELKQQGAEVLILDLRDNGGGLVDSAVGVAGEFIDGGVILYEERQGQSEQVFNAPRGGKALDLPTVVLINQNTASAAEIVAGAMQDRDRAVLVGVQSYGKGSVQLILPMSDGSSLHVTTAQWFTPDHHPLEGQGLIPDVEVQAADGADTQLAAALDYIVQNLLADARQSNTQ